MLLTTATVAKEFGVTTQTVRRWIAEGKMKAVQTPGAHFRVSLAEVERFKEVR
jgi:excisionase family DNA binding protein